MDKTNNEELSKIFLINPENRRVAHNVAMCVCSFADVMGISENKAFYILIIAANADLEKNRSRYLRLINEIKEEIIAANADLEKNRSRYLRLINKIKEEILNILKK
jgi:hypothetical protein